MRRCTLLLSVSLLTAASCFDPNPEETRECSQTMLGPFQANQWSRSVFSLYPRDHLTYCKSLTYDVYFDAIGKDYEIYEDEKMWGRVSHVGDFRYSLLTFKTYQQPFPSKVEELIEAIQVDPDEKLTFQILNWPDPEVVYALRIEGVCFDSTAYYEKRFYIKEVRKPRYVSCIIYYTKRGRFILFQSEMEKSERFLDVFDPIDWKPTAEEQAIWQRMVSSITFQASF